MGPSTLKSTARIVQIQTAISVVYARSRFRVIGGVSWITASRESQAMCQPPSLFFGVI